MNVLLEARWTEGLWLGRNWGTPHHRIGNTESIWEVRAVQRRPESQRWFPNLLGAIRATPWQNPAPPVGTAPAITLPPLPADEQAAARETDEASRNVKSVYIRKPDLEKYGYTASCGRCQKMRFNTQHDTRWYHSTIHNLDCRTRIEQAMADAGDTRLGEAMNRMTHRLEEKMAAQEEIPCAPSLGPVTTPATALPTGSALSEYWHRTWLKTGTGTSHSSNTDCEDLEFYKIPVIDDPISDDDLQQPTRMKMFDICRRGGELNPCGVYMEPNW